ncbi:N-lysine methyltransferase KMT5A-like [Ptychodera flava]|uniref:N-lysine methyltransferase KMT5A-like n=1 Tax=Ptychodera flava TaxID=63121 RepID=UPI003969DCF9
MDRSGWFCVKQTETKGRGVFAVISIKAGEFLMEYSGELDIGRRWERKGREHVQCISIFFKFKNKDFCIDATQEPGSHERMLGRLVNHGRKNEVNAKMKVIVNDHEQPTLCLFSTKLIKPGQEVLFDYGINNLPWENPKLSAVAGTHTKRAKSSNDVTLQNVRNNHLMKDLIGKHTFQVQRSSPMLLQWTILSCIT